MVWLSFCRLLRLSGQFEHGEETTPVFDAGQWKQAWIIVPDSDEQIAAETEAAWDALRAQRDVRLFACDWTQLSDAPLTTDEKTAWTAYRQELRDLPENTTDPFNPVWPTPPDETSNGSVDANSTVSP